MDQNDANQNCCDLRKDQKVGEEIENATSSNNASVDKINYAVLNEDGDWDIYQSGMVYGTETSIESRFSFENAVSQNERHLSKNNSVSFVDSDSCQRSTPHVGRRTNHSPSSNLANIGGTFPECNKDRILAEVKLFFLSNPVRVNPLKDLESKKSTTSSPYFSRSFALKHGLPLPPAVTPIQELKVTSDVIPEWRINKVYDIICKTGIPTRDFSCYILIMLTPKGPDASPQERFKQRELDPFVMECLDSILSVVGPDIFIAIYKKLTKEKPESSVNFRLQKLVDDGIEYWTAHRNCLEHYREQDTDAKYPIMLQNEIHSSLDNDFTNTPTNEDSPRKSSQTHVSSTPSPNASNSNLFSDVIHMKTQHKLLKTNQSPMDSLEVQSQQLNDNSECDSKKPSSFLKSSHRKKEIRMPFDSLQAHSNKTNETTDTAPIILPHIRNSLDQIDEDVSRKGHSIKPRDSPNNGAHSSFQNSGEHQSGKEFIVLENISSVQTGDRKHILKNDDSKSRKKIRMQENSNTGQPESDRK